MGERAIRIESEGVRLYAILSGTPAAGIVWDALPLVGTAHVQDRLGVILETALRFPEEAPAAVRRAGDLLFSPGGGTIVLASDPDSAGAASSAERPAVPYVAFGRITGDATRLQRVRDGGRLRLTALEG